MLETNIYGKSYFTQKEYLQVKNVIQPAVYICMKLQCLILEDQTLCQFGSLISSFQQAHENK